MSRPVRLALALVAALVFAAVTVAVARILGASTAARDRVVELVKLQAGGAEREVVARIDGCSERPSCAAGVRARVLRLAGPGRFHVLRVDGVANFALGSRTETARVAWRAGDRLPVVQCVGVRRAGDPLAGYDVSILSLGPPIGREEEC